MKVEGSRWSHSFVLRPTSLYSLLFVPTIDATVSSTCFLPLNLYYSNQCCHCGRIASFESFNLDSPDASDFRVFPTSSTTTTYKEAYHHQTWHKQNPHPAQPAMALNQSPQALPKTTSSLGKLDQKTQQEATKLTCDCFLQGRKIPPNLPRRHRWKHRDCRKVKNHRQRWQYAARYYLGHAGYRKDDVYSVFG